MTDTPTHRVSSTTQVVTAAQHERAIVDEYSYWVATEAIFVDGARAFNPGDPVPRSHVDSGLIPKDMVATRASGQAAMNPTAPAPEAGTTKKGS